MTKDIFLSLKGLQFGVNEQTEELETITPADYYLRNGSHYVVYDELLEGCEETIKNMIKFKDSSLEVIKRGSMNVHMIFEENRKNITTYATPYGNILIGIDTGTIRIDEQEDCISVEVDYTLEANYQYLADCQIRMNLLPRKEEIKLLEH